MKQPQGKKYLLNQREHGRCVSTQSLASRETYSCYRTVCSHPKAPQTSSKMDLSLNIWACSGLPPTWTLSTTSLFHLSSGTGEVRKQCLKLAKNCNWAKKLWLQSYMLLHGSRSYWTQYDLHLSKDVLQVYTRYFWSIAAFSKLKTMQHQKGSPEWLPLIGPPRSTGTAITTAPKCHRGQDCLPTCTACWGDRAQKWLAVATLRGCCRGCPNIPQWNGKHRSPGSWKKQSPDLACRLEFRDQ